MEDMDGSSGSVTPNSGHSTIDAFESPMDLGEDDEGEEMIDLDLAPPSPATSVGSTDSTLTDDSEPNRPTKGGLSVRCETLSNDIITLSDADGKYFMCPISDCQKRFDQKYKTRYISHIKLVEQLEFFWLLTNHLGNISNITTQSTSVVTVIVSMRFVETGTDMRRTRIPMTKSGFVFFLIVRSKGTRIRSNGKTIC
jgi:hypothetical protein